MANRAIHDGFAGLFADKENAGHCDFDGPIWSKV
jgi:hypothetical protein